MLSQIKKLFAIYSDWREGTAVMRRDAEPLQRYPVLLRAVSCVVIPAVAGVRDR
jgi:hypothetical protein